MCCLGLFSSLTWRSGEREVLACFLLDVGIGACFLLTSHKGTRLTLRQWSVWGEEDKIELQLTAEPVSAITMHCK